MAFKIYIEDKDKPVFERYAITPMIYDSFWRRRAENFPNIAFIEKDDIYLFPNNFNFEAKDITAEDLLDLKKAKAKITKQILDILEPKIEAKGYYVDDTSLKCGELNIDVRKVKVETKEEVKQETKEEVKETSRNNNNDAGAFICFLFVIMIIFIVVSSA